MLIPSDLEQLKPPSWSLLGLFIGLDLLALCIGAIFLRMWGTTRAARMSWSTAEKMGQLGFNWGDCSWGFYVFDLETFCMCQLESSNMMGNDG